MQHILGLFSGGSKIYETGGGGGGGGVANFKGGGKNLLFGQIFPENCMKMKEFGPRGHVIGAPLDLPLVYCFSDV